MVLGMAVNRSQTLRLSLFGAFFVSVIALVLVLGHSSATVRADTDADFVTFTDVPIGGTMSTRFVDQPVRITGPRHIARNVIVGNAIAVCTPDYPNAVAQAVSGWNADLKNHTPSLLATDKHAFATPATCIGNPRATDIEYVKVESRRPDDNDFYCRNVAAACFLRPPRTRTVHQTYTGKLLVIMNERLRPSNHDTINDLRDLNYKRIVRTIAHELGHVLGLGDYDCDNPPQFPSLMVCAKESDAYPAQVKDLADYRAIYEPNRVIQRGSRSFAANVYVEGNPGTVEFNFDARGVIVEDHIELRRWNGTEWKLVQEFPADTGQTRWIARGQPSDGQKYRFFSMTHALIEGQCFVNDSDCDPSNNVGFFLPGARIGFPTTEIRLEVEQADVPPPPDHILDLTVVGLGQVNQTPDMAAYHPAELVTLEAAPNVDSYKADTDDDDVVDISEVATLSTFMGWTGDDDALDCGRDPECKLVMREDKTVTATFATNHHQLTINLDDAEGASSYPSVGSHTHTAGTLVRVEVSWDETTHHFSSWHDCTWVDEDRSCLVYMNSKKSVRLVLNDGPAATPIVPGPGPLPDLGDPHPEPVIPGPVDPTTCDADTRPGNVAIITATTTHLETQWRTGHLPVIGCIEYEERRTVTTYTVFTVTYTCVDGGWFGTIAWHTSTNEGPWTPTGNARSCNLARSATPGQYRLPSGQHELEWDGQRIAFTVPAGSSVELAWRQQDGGAYVAVLSTKKGAELVVGADALSGDDQARSTRFASTTDPTLSAIAASLRDPAAEAPESSVTAPTECPVAEPSDDGVTNVDLDTAPCAIVRGGGAVTVAQVGHSLAITLAAERDWSIMNMTGADQAETAAVMFFDFPTGGSITLALTDGSELARNIPEGNTELPALFDAMIPAAPADDGS